MAQKNLKVDSALLKGASKILKTYHLTPTEAVNLFLNAVNEKNALPFDLFKSNQDTQANALFLKTLVDILAAQCEYLFYIDITNDHYRQFTMKGGYVTTDENEIGANFFEETYKNIDVIIYKDDREKLRKALTKDTLLPHLVEGKIFTINYRMITSGSPVYYNMRVSRSAADPNHIIAEVRNIQSQVNKENDFKEKIKKAQDEARYDALTGCYNYLAMEEAKELLNDKIRNGTYHSALALCDLNDLKIINDTFGHPKGDEYLVESVAIIKKHFPHSCVFRVGGDEFIIVIMKEDFEKRDQLIENFTEEIINNIKEFKPIIAIGKAEIIDQNTTTDQLIAEADKQMYINKFYLKAKQKELR